jgi:hypothetical protein
MNHFDKAYILNLPNELLDMILKYLVSGEEAVDGTIYAVLVSQVCKRFRALSTPFLYRHMLSSVRGMERPLAKTTLKNPVPIGYSTLLRNPEYRLCCKTLGLGYKVIFRGSSGYMGHSFHIDSPVIAVVQKLLPWFVNLETLEIACRSSGSERDHYQNLNDVIRLVGRHSHRLRHLKIDHSTFIWLSGFYTTFQLMKMPKLSLCDLNIMVEIDDWPKVPDNSFCLLLV